MLHKGPLRWEEVHHFCTEIEEESLMWGKNHLIGWKDKKKRGRVEGKEEEDFQEPCEVEVLVVEEDGGNILFILNVRNKDIRNLNSLITMRNNLKDKNNI